MKDHRFIELVNLYIDRQITAAETAELEAEIQRSPRRRAVYRQYCQMHRATTLVYDSFRAQAADQPAATPAVRSTIARFQQERRGRSYRWVNYAGGLAAAACLTLVFVHFSSRSATPAVTAPATVASVPVAAAVPTAQAPTGKAAESRVDLVGLRNAAAAETDYPALLANLRLEEQRNAATPAGRLPSLFDDGVFESQQVFPVGSQRTFRSRQNPAQPGDPLTAFQFQR
jgi:hypothetical protein